MLRHHNFFMQDREDQDREYKEIRLEQIRAYKEKGTIPYIIDFKDENWAAAIQQDIDKLQHDLIDVCESVDATAGIVALGSLACCFVAPWSSCAALTLSLTAGTYIHDSLKKSIDEMVNKLINVFLKIKPEDTSISPHWRGPQEVPVTINLIKILGPLVMDEKVMLNWIDKGFPQKSIDAAHASFKAAMSKSGYFDIRNFNTLKEAKDAYDTEKTHFQTHPLSADEKNKLYLFRRYGKESKAEAIKTYKFYVRGYLAAFVDSPYVAHHNEQAPAFSLKCKLD